MKSDSRLSRRDQNNMDENYYEGLSNPGAYSPALAQVYYGKPHDWNINPAVKQNPNGFPPYDHLPSITTPYKGATWITNRWGMRDRDYAKQKPSGTYRIAMLGASHTAGAGVEGHETFENLVEDRLNRQCTNDKYRKFEIMNFAVGGYGPLCKLAKMQQQLFEFQPDAVLYVAIDDFTWIVREMANATEKEIPIPYPYIVETTKKVGATKRMPKSFVATRLEPHKEELVRWVYAEFVQQCRDHHVHPFAAFIPKPDYKGSNRTAIPLQLKLAAEAGFTTLDVSDAYDELEDIETLWVAKWDRHPNPYGHRLLAKKLYRRLVTELVSMGVVDADADVVRFRGQKNRHRRDVSSSSTGHSSRHLSRSSPNHNSDVYQAVILRW